MSNLQLSTKERFIQMMSDLAKEIEDQIKLVMKQKGVPSKQGGLYDSVTSSYNNNELSWFATFYYEYLSKGRKKFIKRVPHRALLKWIQRYNIRPRDPSISQNQLAWIIQSAIYKNGIQGRNFIEAVNQTVQDTFEAKIDADLLATITVELDEYFR